MKDLTKALVVSAFVLVLVASMAAPRAKAQFTISVWTDSPMYNVGDPVRVSFETPGSGISATATIDIYGPFSATWGPASITTGTIYTATISGVTQVPGYYQVKVTLALPMDIYTGSTSFQVMQPPPFDFKLIISPETLTVKKGQTAQFSLSRTVSDPYYEDVSVKITDVSGLGVGMTWKVIPGTPATLKLTTTDSTPPGTYVFTVTGMVEGETRSTTGTLIVEATFDFSIAVSPSTQTVNIGQKTTFAITVTLMTGTPQAVTLSLGGLPGDLTYAFSITSSSPTFTSTLTIDASAASSQGTYTLTITGAGGGFTRAGTTSLTIKDARDFSLTSSPSTITVKQGEEATFTIGVKQIEGFQGVVTLTASGLPQDATYTFNPSSGTPDFTSKLVIKLASSTPVGTYTITIGGSGGGKIHSLPFELNVEKKSWLPFPIPGCLIATAAYGSELSPQVQALRLFRDKLVLSTFAGTQFMKAFNSWYYSFSPTLAKYVAGSSSLAWIVRALVYPLIGILKVASAAYALFSFAPEVGVTVAGLVASSLIGLVYDTPWIAVLLIAFRKRRGFQMKLRYFIPFAVAWIVSLALVGVAEYLLAPMLMIVAASSFVILTMSLSATGVATLIARKLR